MVNRITGFSGLDVETMVEKLMKAERVPLDKINQKKQLLEWKRDDYRTINSKILDFRNVAFNMKLQGPYLANTASSSDDTVVTAKGTSSAMNGNHEIRVHGLAATALKKSEPALNTPSTGSATTLSTMGLSGDTTLTISGEKGSATIAVDGDDSIASFVANVNAVSSKTGVRVTYEENMKRFFITSTNTGSNAKIDFKTPDATLLNTAMGLASEGTANIGTITGTRTFTSGASTLVNSSLTAEQTFTITYNGKTSEIKYDKGTTIGQLLTKINSSDVGKQGVSAYLDSSNKLVIVNPDTGLGAIAFANTDSDGEDAFSGSNLSIGGIAEAAGTYQKISGSGTNASIEYNGVTADYQSNTVNIAGVEFTAKKIYTGNPPITVSIAQDVDKIYNSIKELIDKYNDTISEVNKKLDESRYRNFEPLTEEQKKEMDEDDIKKWEEKAKSGLLRNDTLLSTSISSFRQGLFKEVKGIATGGIKQLSEIGITTLSYADKGKLTINEAKLREAISQNPDEVMKLFTAADEDPNSDDEDGLAVRLYNLADQAWKGIKDKAGTTSSRSSGYLMGEELDRIESRVVRMLDMLTNKEDRYYKQFSAMETAIQKYNSQSSYLMSFFGGGQ